MALEELTKYMSDYRTKRIDAFNNQKRMRWFTSEVPKLPDLITVVCATDKPNSTWEGIYLKGNKADKKDRRKLKGYRTEVAFVAGCRRDLRTLFMAGDTNRDRVELDYGRYEAQRLNYLNGIMGVLQKNVKDIQGVT